MADVRRDDATCEVWYAPSTSTIGAAVRRQFDPDRVARVERQLAKARTKDSMQAFSKLTQVVDGEPRIVSDPPLIVPIST